VELHTDPAAGFGEGDGESLWVTSCVGRVVDGADEACLAMAQGGLDGGELVGIEKLLVSAVLA
jgi:hypothetical protein